MKSTPEMRARLRELFRSAGPDDYDRAVSALQDDFDELYSKFAELKAGELDASIAATLEDWADVETRWDDYARQVRKFLVAYFEEKLFGHERLCECGAYTPFGKCIVGHPGTCSNNA